MTTYRKGKGQVEHTVGRHMCGVVCCVVWHGIVSYVMWCVARGGVMWKRAVTEMVMGICAWYGVAFSSVASYMLSAGSV